MSDGAGGRGPAGRIMLHSLRTRLTHFFDQASLEPAVSRAVRATVAFMVPMVLALTGSLPVEASFAAIAAQNIAIVDLRGDYRVRFGLLVAMAAVLAAATALGSAASGQLALALGATALMALAGGVWRHLSLDYGPSLAISSSFVFLLALATTGNVGQHTLAALAGAGWGVALQLANWPFRPQHAVRRAVADSWLAVADLITAISPGDSVDARAQAERIAQAESALRAALDGTYATLEAGRAGALRPRLAALHLSGARLATRIVSLHTALESIATGSEWEPLASALEPVCVSLTNLSRGAAVTVVSRQPSQLTTFEVRLRRVRSLLALLRTRAGDHLHLVEIIRHLDEEVMAAHAALRATIERADETAATSFELLDLRALALKPLASSLNLSPRVDPALVRYTLRLAVLTTAAVAVFKSLHLPHGYWLPFTIVVVLQPDYGSTRERAAQRVLGTVTGGLAASGLLWLRVPTVGLMLAAAATMFAFGYWLKRSYAIAIFFITLFIVLLTDATEPVTLAFTIERLASTLAGGALALVAAQLFWPVWERERFPPLLAEAFRANRDYLRILVDQLTSGGSFDREAIARKRRVESANSVAFSSLKRMSGDPRNQRDTLEVAAALANGNQRLTRALNVLTLHFAPGTPLSGPELEGFAVAASEALDALAQGIERGIGLPVTAQPLIARLQQTLSARESISARERFIAGQLGRAATELSALLLASPNSESDGKIEG